MRSAADASQILDVLENALSFAAFAVGKPQNPSRGSLASLEREEFRLPV